MSLKGRGQGVDLGTSTLSLMRSIFFSFFGRAFPYDPLNRFPFFVFLSPRPHTIGAPIELILAAAATAEEDGDEVVVKRARCSVISTRLATAPHHCIIAISPPNSLSTERCCERGRHI
ncbi:PREDICTED: EUGRSUZ_I01330 [Prunus dulcis]|uniref:PREDICTED: EUGRSUZ_I01330 n=1 Tax=Prunus dulcis TaxID=3755 RepID=A0A5E4GB94_PRUDU|nr:PREDICTED: EUGRSUZ_I01330 [Prunus dulcis]